MAAPQLRLTIENHAETIGLRLLHIADDMANGSRHHGSSEGFIAEPAQAAIDFRVAVRGR